MNYYPFHIGDYASATRHLTWDEDLAYRRMLDWCYTNEKPLPIDVAKVCRLIVATSDAQRVAAETVLSEFFVSTCDGWVHERVTAEIERMRERQEASEERDEHEKTRQQKHRERRSAMFAKLSEVGVFPAWNAKTGELERLISEHCDAPVTAGVHREAAAPVTAPETPATSDPSQQGQPATAIPTPTPTPTPTPIEEKRGDAPRKRSTPAPAVDQPDDVDQQTWADFLTLRKAKRAPVTETVLDGARTESEKAGMTLDAFLQVWCLRGSQGLLAEWLRPEERRTASRVQPVSFAQKDKADRRAEWEAMTGRKWPSADAVPEFIDAEEINPKRIAA